MLLKTFYFVSIQGASTSEGKKYVGCYKDEGDPRAFRSYVENFNDLTPQKCTEFCYSKGFLYSATQGRYIFLLLVSLKLIQFVNEV